jgi:enoyl-CoA hydratase/carnithine racemase
MRLLYYHDAAFLVFRDFPVYPRLKRKLLEEMVSALEVIRRDPVFRGVVIASNAQSWATGAAIEEVSELSAASALEFARFGQNAFDVVAHFPLPVVAAIRGFCLGGGLDLALACHSRVASLNASFGHPGAALGLVTGWGGTQRLPRLVGKAQALVALLTAERIPATQALNLNLVDELVPDRELWDAAARSVDSLSARL